MLIITTNHFSNNLLDFELYLAITQGTYKSYFQRQLTQMIINRNQVKLLIVDAESEVIVQWIN